MTHFIAGPTLTQAAQKTMKAVSFIPNLNVFVRLNISANCKQITENNARRAEQLSGMSIQLKYSLLTFLFCVYIENMHPDKDKVSLPTFLRAEVS